MLELHRCTCAVRESALHRGEREVGVNRNHHDGRDLTLHLYMYVVRELALHRGVSDLVLRHHDGRVVHVLELRLYMNVVDDLLVHHHDVRAVRESVLRRCTYAVRERGDRLRNDCVLREFQLAFRHPYVVVCPKDSKHRYCAWRHELQRVEILLCCVHLGRVVREVHGIRLLPP